LYHFAQRLVLTNKDESYNKIGNGLLLLKGGDLTEELATVKRKAKIYPIYNYFPETYFEEKYLIHLRV
jgi:16S rRNA (guanine527-N7)-methyltransferase